MFLLTLRDLQFRRSRLVVVTVLAGVVFTLLFLMTGLVEQFNREPFEAVDAAGSTHWVVAEGVNSPFTAASALPATLVDELAGDPEPAVVARSTLDDGELAQQVILVGAEVDGRVAPPLVDGRPVAGADEIVVDDAAGVPVGTEVTLAGRPFTVVGVSERTTLFAGVPFAFVDLPPAQELTFGSDALVSTVLLAAEPAAVPDGTELRTADEIGADGLTPLDGAIGSVNLIRVLLWIVATVIVGAVVYLSALERSRDFAVLKAIGATNRDLVIGLAVQAVVIALVAVAVAAVLQALIQPVFPLRVQVPGRAYWQLPLVAVVASLVSAIAGMRRVAGADPAAAFAGAS